jgi:hypothetical protein
MRSISGRLAVILTAGFSLMACKAPVTVTFPTNGEVSKDPVVSVTLRFDSWFVSQPYDGLYLDGTPYVWANFSPPPAAGGTSSLSGACPEYASTKVSVGIGYTCGTLCTAGIPAFTFQPPHFTMESEQTTTNDLTFNSAGDWTTYSVYYVVGTNIAAPSSAIEITIKDVTPGGPATELCATAPAPGVLCPPQAFL